MDLHALRLRGWQILSDVVGLDRQLTVSSIDEHHELDETRPAEFDQRIERGSDRPARIKHIVDEQNPPIVD